MSLPQIHDRWGGFLLLLLILALCRFTNRAAGGPEEAVPSAEGRIFIQVEGDVLSPGVYRFSENPGLSEVMEKAGGPLLSRFLPETGSEKRIPSGTCLTVLGNPERGGAVPHRDMRAFYRVTLGIPIHLNRETAEGLTAVPGIGPELAKAIVRERQRLGGFRRLGDMKKIRGIGEHVYGKIHPYLSL